MNWHLTGGEVLGSGARDIMLADGVVAGAGRPERRFDASGLILAPGLCDVHGDGFERNLSPRSGVLFPVETALLATDRELAANGITTAWLALTISWEPGLRSLEMAGRVIETLERLRPRLLTEIRVQLRWEIFALDAVPVIEKWLALRPRPVLAFNDHLSGTVEDEANRHRKSLDSAARRAGLAPEDYWGLIRQVVERADEVPGAVRRLSGAARAAGVTCFAHDEPDAKTRIRNRADGIVVSEFPLSAEAATAAVAADEPTVLGAPNVVRGGSHIGCLDAAPAIADGLCTVLASDYFYPSMLQAVQRLEADGVLPPDRVWPLVTSNAARACGLTDRGDLMPGQRGDVIALARTGTGFSVQAVFRRGRPVMVLDAARIG